MYPVLQRKLGTPHIGPMDPSCSGGVPARSDRDPIPEKVPSQGSVEGQYGIHDPGGGREPVQETSNKSSSSTEGSVFEPDFLGPKEKWLPMSGSQPEATQLSADEEEIQDGRSEDDQGPDEKGRLDIDLKDAYLSVPICSNHRQYLRFQWKEVIYEFQCLPFGLSSAPRTFTKILKLVIALLRKRGIRCMIFLDDMLVMARMGKELESQIQSIVYLLQQLGFRINWEKSIIVPSQVIQYVGFMVDLRQMLLSLPEEKNDTVVTSGQAAILKKRVSVRDLARLIGRMSATMLAVLPAPLCYRGLQALKIKAFAASQSFETEVDLDRTSLAELEWWVREVQHWNGCPIQAPQPDLVIETDVSLLGWGASSGQNSTGVYGPRQRELDTSTFWSWQGEHLQQKH